MQVCFPVRSMRSFLVTPLPKRLCGGNTACGCPCPSPLLSLFLSCSLYLIFPLVLSRSSFPALSSPSLFVSAAFFAQSIAVVWASHRGTRQHFPSTFPASLPPSYFSVSLLQLFFFHFHPPFSISISIHTSKHIPPYPDGCSCLELKSKTLLLYTSYSQCGPKSDGKMALALAALAI